MAGRTDIAEQLKELISSLKEQGILDEKFDEVMRRLKDERNPRFAVEIINHFYGDAENNLAELTYLSVVPIIDYPQLSNVALNLKEACSSFGCSRMAIACGELRDASEAKNKEGCHMVLEHIRREYAVLQKNLNQIAQLDRAIYENAIRGRYY
ncbi:PREDICTED: histidine-containing [Prunus dulcis]|uniref:Histidine-containing phosphotransfer protein n=1 Tax=Prunus dulcis TaxID=3755 RepID=A0A5E4FDX4_PRUDU|nr:PREDICTED: histidine-containing [Prunus dulcis]